MCITTTQTSQPQCNQVPLIDLAMLLIAIVPEGMMNWTTPTIYTVFMIKVLDIADITTAVVYQCPRHHIPPQDNQAIHDA